MSINKDQVIPANSETEVSDLKTKAEAGRPLSKAILSHRPKHPGMNVKLYSSGPFGDTRLYRNKNGSDTQNPSPS